MPDSSATRQRADEIRLFIKETADKLAPGEVVRAAMPLWLVVVLAIFPMGVTLLSVAGAAYVGSYRLNEMEKVMARVEGALSTIELVEYRVSTLEDENRKRERDIRMVEEIARNNKTNVRTAAHDIATFRTFLPTAAKAADEGVDP